MNTRNPEVIVHNSASDSSDESVALEVAAKVPKNTPTPTKRKKVDPNAPKRAVSAFVLFSQAERVAIKRDQPDTPSAVMFRLLGERWKAADADTKAKYATMHSEHKAIADEARRVYATEVQG